MLWNLRIVITFALHMKQPFVLVGNTKAGPGQGPIVEHILYILSLFHWIKLLGCAGRQEYYSKQTPGRVQYVQTLHPNS